MNERDAVLVSPQRIQRRRVKGYRMGDAVYVGRGSKWGNPFRVGTDDDLGEVRTAEEAVRLFEDWMMWPERWGLPDPWELGSLRGRDLACWCPLDRPCHADVLLRLANT